MITEEDKFRADTLRILGITLITPIAKFLLDPYLFLREHDIVYTMIYVIIASWFGIIGFTQIEIARGILDKREKHKWTS